MSRATFCPECGWGVAIDEDGLCVHCGATACGSAVDDAASGVGDPLKLREALEFFAGVGRELLTQDNRATSEPVFFIEETRERVRHEDTYPIDGDGERVTTETRIAYRHRVTACLTQKGADAYFQANGHNLREPDSYVETGCRNQEWIDLRAACIAAARLRDSQEGA